MHLIKLGEIMKFDLLEADVSDDTTAKNNIFCLSNVMLTGDFIYIKDRNFSWVSSLHD